LAGSQKVAGSIPAVSTRLYLEATMLKTILWELALFCIRLALKLGKDFMAKALELVIAANALKHTDGSDYSGKEKYDYVFSGLLLYAKDYKYDMADMTSTLNTVIEVTLKYVKSKLG
jgi:hypothetical protein